MTSPPLAQAENNPDDAEAELSLDMKVIESPVVLCIIVLNINNE